MALQGFNEEYYLGAKLAALQADPATAADWAGKDTAFLSTVLDSFGFTAESHYQDYGWAEGLAPNAYFNAAEYKLAKAEAMFDEGGYWSVDDALAFFEEAWPYDPYLHYLAYGSAEGINPSNDFDESSYYESKLADLQADPDTADEWADKTPDDVKAAFEAAGLTALGHYEAYGRDEGIPVTEVPASEQVDPGSVNPGETFVLTTDLDVLVGTDGDDTFNAVLNDDEYIIQSTFNSGDSVDGGNGDDTLILTATDDESEDNVVYLDNIENVVVRNLADTRLFLEAGEWSGVDNFVVSGGNDDVSFDHVPEAFSNVTIENFGYNATAYETVGIRVLNSVFSGGDDAVTVTLDNVGAAPVKVPEHTIDNDLIHSGSNASIDGEYAYLDIDNDDYDSVIETFNFISTGDNDRGNFLKVEDTLALETVNISGTTDLNLHLNTDGSSSCGDGVLTVVDASALEADLWLRGASISSEGVTIIGATGDNDLKGSAFDDTITTFDGDDIIRGLDGDDVINAGDGDNDVRGDSGNNTITTGAGDDFIHAGGDGDYDNTVDAGDGDDVVQVGQYLAEGDDIDGGDGYDMLWMDADLAEAVTLAEDEDFADLFQNFEVLRLGDLEAPLDMAYFDDIQHLVLSHYLNDATIDGLSDGATLEFWNYSSDYLDDTTVNLTDVSGDETFNVVISADSYTDDFGRLVIDGVETINLEVTTRCKDFDLWDDDDDGIDPSMYTYTFDIDGDALETLNITGDLSLDLSTFALTTVETVNAGTFTGDLDISIVGNDNGVTITSGAGDDTIAVDLGLNTLTGGDGDDAFEIGVSEAGTIFSTITDIEDGETVTFSGFGTETVTADMIELAGVAVFQDYLDAAAAGNGSVNANYAWFQFDGNTYIVEDSSIEATFQSGGDSVVELAGIFDLTDSMIAGTNVLTMDFA
ncbi:hypothetical protein [Desulfobacula sp.]|uniref:calcium-binding protein n=1 Tax=Desulfobacula sp. TaxID=2593537 RepID=UPI0025C283AD|nr:hypothetical protein [Desulfobacula sp.]MBC2704943.1 hypothetical protein [Desulfobacula sp.]